MNASAYAVPRRYLLLLCAFLIVGSCFGFVYWRSVAKRSDYLTRRNFRALASHAARFRESLTRSAYIIETVADSATLSDNEYETKPTRLAAVLPSAALSDREDFTQFLKFNPHREQQRAGLEFIADFGTSPGWQPEGGTDLLELLADNLDPLRLPLFSEVAVKPTGEAATPETTLLLGSSEGQPSIRLTTTLPQQQAQVAVWIKLRDAFPPLPSDGLFDALAFLQPDGEFVTFASVGGLGQGDVPQLADAEGKLIDGHYLRTHGNQARVVLEGEEFRLFAHPISLPYPLQNALQRGSTPAYLCGFSQSSSFNAESRKLPYPVITGFVFTLALLALSWPFLRLWTITSQEAIRRKDIIQIIYNTLLVLSLSSLFLADFYFSTRIEERFDESLKKLSRAISDKLSWEVTQIARQLERFQNEDIYPEFAEDSKSIAEPDNKKTAEPRERFLMDLARAPRKGLDEEPYPFFDMVFWTDRQGRQMIKWTAEEKATPYIDVSERPYFRGSVQNGVFRDLPGDTRYRLDPIVSITTGQLQAVLTMRPPEAKEADLLLAAAVVRLQSVADVVLPAGYGFAVVRPDGDVRIHSDPRRAASENLLEESDQNSELRSILFAEGSGELNSTYSGRHHRMSVRPISAMPGHSLVVYRDREIVRTVRLEILTVAVFLSLVFSGVLLVVLCVPWAFSFRHLVWYVWPHDQHARLYVGFGGLFLLLGIAVVVGGAFGAEATAFWLACLIPLMALCIQGWLLPPAFDPDTSRRPWLIFLRSIGTRMRLPGYRVTPRRVWRWMVGTGVAAAALAAFWFIAHEETLLVKIITGGLLIAVLIFVVLASRSSEMSRAEQSGLSASTTYAFAGMSLLALLGVFPTLTFYRIAHDAEMELMIRHAQMSVAEKLAGRVERVRGEYGRRVNGEDLNAVLTRRLSFSQPRDTPESYAEPLDVYAAFLQDSVTGNRPPEQCVLIDRTVVRRWCQTFRPAYNSFAVETGGLLDGRSDEGSWKAWRCPAVDGGGTPRLTLSRSGHTIDSDPPRLSHPPWWVWVLGFSFVAIALFGFIRQIESKLMLSRVVEERKKIPGIDLSNVDRNTLVLGRPLSGKTQALKQQENLVHRLDLAVVDADWRSDSLAERAKRSRKPVVALDHFEFDLGNPAAVRSKVRLLEKLIHENGIKVVVVSNVDPEFFLRHNGGIDESADDAPDTRRDINRLMTILGDFDHHVIDEDAEGIEGYQLSIHNCRNQILDRSDPAPTPPAKQYVETVLSSTEELLGGWRPVQLSKQQNLRLEIMYRVIQASMLHRKLRTIGQSCLDLVCAQEPLRRGYVFYHFLDKANGYYRGLWNSCSRDEKLLLNQMARGSLVIPKSSNTIRELTRKGLVRQSRPADPFEIVNSTFATFVKSVLNPSEMRRWEDEAANGWQAVASPFAIGLVLAAGIIFVNEREAIGAIVDQISSGANPLAALPVLAPVGLRLLAGWRSQTAGAQEPG